MAPSSLSICHNWSRHTFQAHVNFGHLPCCARVVVLMHAWASSTHADCMASAASVQMLLMLTPHTCCCDVRCAICLPYPCSRVLTAAVHCRGWGPTAGDEDEDDGDDVSPVLFWPENTKLCAAQAKA